MGQPRKTTAQTPGDQSPRVTSHPGWQVTPCDKSQHNELNWSMGQPRKTTTQRTVLHNPGDKSPRVTSHPGDKSIKAWVNLAKKTLHLQTCDKSLAATYLIKFAGPLGLEACVITCMLCSFHDLSFLYEGPSGAKSRTSQNTRIHLFDL